MSTNALPPEVVERDHELETQVGKTTEALADQRWHWTLDESNPDRVSFSEYGRQVGRSHKTIGAMARGYASWTAAPRAGTAGLTECIERARQGVERSAAIDAVAKDQGIAYAGARKIHAPIVAEVLEAAREKAEANDTSVEHEIPIVMHERKVKEQEAANWVERQKVQAKGDTVDLELQAKQLIGDAHRKIDEYMRVIDGVEFSEQTRGWLSADLDRLREKIVDAAVLTSGVTFDARDRPAL